jgi:hypothetical protein
MGLLEITKPRGCPDGSTQEYKVGKKPCRMQGPFPNFLNSPAAYEPEEDGDNRYYQEYVNDVADTEHKCSQ